MGRDRFHGRAIGGVHGENGIVDPRQRGGSLDRRLDARLGPKVHSGISAFFDIHGCIDKVKHGSLLEYIG